jgi:hypothetical protein
MIDQALAAAQRLRAFGARTPTARARIECLAMVLPEPAGLPACLRFVP